MMKCHAVIKCLLLAPQTTSKADPKAVSAHGVAAAMAADTSRPLDMLIIANRLEKGAFLPR